MGISNHECSNVHIGTGKSHSDMDEHRLLHNCFMPDMYKDEYLKKNQILDMTTCISEYYLGLYPQFSIYSDNTGKNYRLTKNIFVTIMTIVFSEHHKQKLRCKPTY
jgi:hypothetical protein